ncbi:vegetative cell wall protein gp1-like [Ananas comosus]|uniref:Vegetative cell wall protein gp1-like n=1 Tax=Ananas comosus TaxID=4615 RepID=A0A6P5GYY3_ANACO|nr:vegetative cell wall protein gp1-like [Ananas comosus]
MAKGAFDCLGVFGVKPEPASFERGRPKAAVPPRAPPVPTRAPSSPHSTSGVCRGPSPPPLPPRSTRACPIPCPRSSTTTVPPPAPRGPAASADVLQPPPAVSSESRRRRAPFPACAKAEPEPNLPTSAERAAVAASPAEPRLRRLTDSSPSTVSPPGPVAAALPLRRPNGAWLAQTPPVPTGSAAAAAKPRRRWPPFLAGPCPLQPPSLESATAARPSPTLGRAELEPDPTTFADLADTAVSTAAASRPYSTASCHFRSPPPRRPLRRGPEVCWALLSPSLFLYLFLSSPPTRRQPAGPESAAAGPVRVVHVPFLSLRRPDPVPIPIPWCQFWDPW